MLALLIFCIDVTPDGIPLIAEDPLVASLIKDVAL